MITKINSLSSFGNYRHFLWAGNPEFKQRNLIYGWNYSGKTTLSRLFQVLSEPSYLSQWSGCSFDVEFSDGSKLTERTLSRNTLIKVFNRGFIQGNFKQENKAPALFMVGGNTIHLSKRKMRLNEHESKINAIKSKLSTHHTHLVKAFESLGTEQARALATLTGDKTYNRPKLLAEIERIKANPQTHTLAEEFLQAKVSLLRSTEQWGAISLVSAPLIDVEALRNQLEIVIQRTASNEAIQRLKDNRDLESWLRTGLLLHHGSTECEFCGSPIQNARIDLLQKHFSKAYEDLLADVAAQIRKLEAIKVEMRLPDERDFMPDIKDQFVELKDRAINWCSWAGSIVDQLKAVATQKQTAIETELCCVIDTSQSLEMVQIISDLNRVITEHNQKIGQIDKEKKAAKELLEKHYAAEFYLTNDVSAKELEIDSAQKKVAEAQTALTKITGKKAKIELAIQQQSVAAQKLNETIQFLLPDNNISVIEVQGGFFEFRRENQSANNLSDGERTAITFAYFLAALEDNGGSLQQTTVFIDDPISSLDSNHIYAIYALITKRLTDCKQLFISTHNSELYGLLKDCWFQQGKNSKDACCYYTRRFLDANQQWNSTLEDMPSLLRKYKSEYQFVFEQLHLFANAMTPTLHEAYTAPNLLRKFLEAYLGFKKPCTPKWSEKLDLLFDMDVERTEIQKFSDDASHLQGLNRALQQPDFVTNAQATVKKVMQALKTKDFQHYESMCKVINVAP